ncbi:UNVERIFIED_CONTAM: hypothetical protein PYX00_002380 [Menopon gallinae]|uniref:Uncharacterized protein n=1 Tax=Menopon gallinae TaxID=328185 RepID=A0AAW2IHH1_9NEOP
MGMDYHPLRFVGGGDDEMVQDGRKGVAEKKLLNDCGEMECLGISHEDTNVEYVPLDDVKDYLVSFGPAVMGKFHDVHSHLLFHNI